MREIVSSSESTIIYVCVTEHIEEFVLYRSNTIGLSAESVFVGAIVGFS